VDLVAIAQVEQERAQVQFDIFAVHPGAEAQDVVFGFGVVDGVDAVAQVVDVGVLSVPLFRMPPLLPMGSSPPP
jgi:hypothetical protein